MWYRQDEGPAGSALADCLRAYRSSDFDACIRQSARVLELAEEDPLLVASVCWMRGGIEEMRGRRGLALRIWGYGLELARASGLGATDVYSLLHRSVASLLDWPRVAIAHAPAEVPLALELRRQLEEHGLQCIDCLPQQADPAAGDDSLRHCLDRATVLFVLWSREFAGDRVRMEELGAVHRRLSSWEEPLAVPRLLLLAVDAVPAPPELAELETLELGGRLDPHNGARLAHLARERSAELLAGIPKPATPGHGAVAG